MTIKMKDGMEYSHCSYVRKGSQGNPLTDEEVQWKFKTLAHFAGLDKKQIKEVIETVEQLEKLDVVTKLTKLLSRAR